MKLATFARMMAPVRGLWRPGRFLAVLAIKKIADRLPAGLVYFTLSLAFFGVSGALRDRIDGLIVRTALRTAIGETRLVRLQFELFRTDDTNFNRKSHTSTVSKTIGISLARKLARQAT